MEVLQIKTSKREEMVDITQRVQELVRDKNWRDGALLLFCPHTTGAVTINESADPSVVRDIVAHMAKQVPHRGDYRHAEGNSDAHIKSSTFGPDLMLIVSNGAAQLGTWQGVFFCDFDGPRSRKLWAQFLHA